ncbi:protein FAM228B-like isoform X2 [Notamacropus eugenii]|uniref:protein FAM228B-like isoform X2 n=1 Tax=Notamacropus eugenii TaxID=9315 RepID=UPI003B678822
MERPFCASHLSKFRITDWPEPKSMDFLEEMYKYLDYQDMLTIKRRELLYRRWSFNVRDPLQQKISEKVSLPHTIIKRKQEESDSYIKYSNKMGNAFINHYDPEEYDPFYMRNKNPGYLKVTLPPFRDPLLQAQQDRDEENRAILQCETGKMYTMKEFKQVKAKQLEALPPFSFARQDRRPNSGVAEGEIRQKMSTTAKPGSAGRGRLPSTKFLSVLKLRPENIQDKVADSTSQVTGQVLGTSGRPLTACSTVDQDEVRSSRTSCKAAEVWAHRPALLRFTNQPASQTLYCMYQEKLAHILCMGQASHTS